MTKTAAGSEQCYTVLNRLAIEGLEAWFFGDCDALRAAYPRVSQTVERRAPFRQPDAIRGGTCEQLERTLQKAGYYPSGLPKIAVAKQVAPYMDPDRNTSPSFRRFCSGLQALIAQ